MSASNTTVSGTSNSVATTRRVTTKAFLGGFNFKRTTIGVKGLFKGRNGSNGGRIGGIGGIVGGGSILVSTSCVARWKFGDTRAQTRLWISPESRPVD